jgi:hypothetical protein
MKNIIITLLILNNLFSLDFFPDKNNTDSNNSFIIDPKNDPNEKTSFIQYDINTTKGTDLNATLVENLVDKLGLSSFNKDLNVSKAEDLKGYVNAIKFNLPTAGNTITNQLKTKVEDFDSKDPATYSKDTILEKDDNSSAIRAIKTMDDFYDNARSRIANLKTIDCYVTRKLVNSYYCPLPSMYNSFFKGGNFKDGKDEAKLDCENLCKEPSSCLSKDMNKDKEVITEYENKLVEFNASIVIDADIGMMGKFIQLDFNSSYKYDDNISINSNDYNETIATKELNSTEHKFKFDVSYYDDTTSKYKKFLLSKTVKIKDIKSSIKIYLDIIRSPKYKINFYDTYKVDNNNSLHDEKLVVKLSKSKLEYIDNKFWFCSSTHFVENANECEGEMKTVIIGSTTYNVCVTDAAKQREPIYGAYYSENQCKSRCKISAQCIPTYRHLTSFDPLNLPDELRDIEIGCVDSPTNTSCTKEICKQLFIEDKMPLVEKSWTSDDNIKVTVANSVQQSGLVRPRIDIEGGLSANGDAEQRKLTSLREMSEISFANMLETNTYNISAQAIKEAIEKKSAYEKIDNDDGYSIAWKLKPNSFDIDDDVVNYLYTIIEVDTQYRPMYGNYETKDGIQSGLTDANIMLLDKVYILKTSTNFKIIKRINNYQGKFKNIICTPQTIDGTTSNVCTSSYKWGPIDAYTNSITKTFLYDDYVDYDLNSKAEYFQSLKFTSDKKFEIFSIFNSTKQIGSIPGVLFKSQLSANRGSSFQRIYDGSDNILEQSIISNLKIYGIYSKSQLTYTEILNLLNSSNAYYSTLIKYPKVIINDGSFINKKVKLYIAGKPEKMSVNIDFSPSSNEEGKKTFIFMLLYEE